jgi:mediator of RNA polymerase II transcription subunit 14
MFTRRHPPAAVPGRSQPLARSRLPPLGGTIRISIAQAPTPTSRSRAGIGPTTRDATARVRAALEERSKLEFIGTGNNTGAKMRPSDEVEGFRFEVEWIPDRGALGVPLNAEDVTLPPEALVVVSHSHSAHVLDTISSQFVA